jgi:hypothetical protein
MTDEQYFTALAKAALNHENPIMKYRDTYKFREVLEREFGAMSDKKITITTWDILSNSEHKREAYIHTANRAFKYRVIHDDSNKEDVYYTQNFHSVGQVVPKMVDHRAPMSRIRGNAEILRKYCS